MMEPESDVSTLFDYGKRIWDLIGELEAAVKAGDRERVWIIAVAITVLDDMVPEP